MARILDTELERLKREVPLQRLVEARGIELKRHGADLLGLCPFHEDREPSLVVSPQKNLWHCLGACQAGGTVVDWVMRAEGVSFRHSVELLRNGAGFESAGEVARYSTRPKLPAPVAPDADDQRLLVQVLDYYHETLKQSPEALRRSAGTKLTEEKYGRIERLAAQRGLTVGEWVLESLLAIAQGDKPAASPTEQALFAEVLALRTIVVNLVYELASEEAVSAERMGTTKPERMPRGSDFALIGSGQCCFAYIQ